jgi:hypothetical protein
MELRMNYRFLILAPAFALAGCVVTPLPPRQVPLACQTQGTAIACQNPDGSWNATQAPPPQEAAPAPAQPQEQEPPPPPPVAYAPPPPYPDYPPPPGYYGPPDQGYPPPPPPGYYGGGYNNGY